MLAEVSTTAVAVVSMGVLGIVFSVGLVVAARFFGVERDPVVGHVLEALPGINCGGCGYSGCEAYAEAVAGGAPVNLCTAGGADVTALLAEIMGVEAEDTVRLRAVCHCQGGRDRCADRFEYFGENDCRAAHMTSGGPKSCPYGCLGLGTCVGACPVAAIAMDDQGLPVVDAAACIACGECVRICPRGLFTLIPADCHIYVACSSRDRGKAVRDVCPVGCIACGQCARKDPHEAIEMADGLPVLDYEKAGGDFTVAAEVCPMNCFLAEEGAPVAAVAASAGQAAGDD